MKTFVLTWVRIPGEVDLVSLITTKWYVTASDVHDAAKKMKCSILDDHSFKGLYSVNEGECFLSASKKDSYWILSEVKEVTTPPPEMQ